MPLKHARTGGASPFEQLPPELLRKILAFVSVDVRDVLAAAGASRTLRRGIDDNYSSMLYAVPAPFAVLLGYIVGRLDINFLLGDERPLASGMALAAAQAIAAGWRSGAGEGLLARWGSPYQSAPQG